MNVQPGAQSGLGVHLIYSSHFKDFRAKIYAAHQGSQKTGVRGKKMTLKLEADSFRQLPAP